MEAWFLIQVNCYKDLALVYIYPCYSVVSTFLFWWSWPKQNLFFFYYSKGRTCPYVQFLHRFGARTLEPRTITKKSIKSCFTCCWDNSLWLGLFLFCRRQCEHDKTPSRFFTVFVTIIICLCLAMLLDQMKSFQIKTFHVFFRNPIWSGSGFI